MRTFTSWFSAALLLATSLVPVNAGWRHLCGCGGMGCPACGAPPMNTMVPYGPPPCAPAYQTVQRTVMVPVYGTATRTIQVTRYRPETRQTTFTAYRQVPVTQQVQREYMVAVPQVRSQTVNYTVCKPVVREVQQQYTVMVPEQQTRTATRIECQMVPEKRVRTVCVDEGHWATVGCDTSSMPAAGCDSPGCDATIMPSLGSGITTESPASDETPSPSDQPVPTNVAPTLGPATGVQKPAPGPAEPGSAAPTLPSPNNAPPAPEPSAPKPPSAKAEGYKIPVLSVGFRHRRTAACSAGSSVGCAPDCAPAPCVAQRVWVPSMSTRQEEYTVMRPQTIEVPYQYTVTVCRPEVRTQTVQVTEMVPEQQTRTVNYTVCVPQRQVRTENVTTFQCVPEQRTASYCVMVPYTALQQIQVPVCQMVQKVITCRVPVPMAPSNNCL
jgi:hypothetical protein